VSGLFDGTASKLFDGDRGAAPADVFGAHTDNSIVARAAAAIARHARPPLLAPVDAATGYVVVDDVGPVIARLLGQHGWGGEAYNMAESSRGSS
jgi:uncharacterized protein YbjT (DUF2867 family)